MATLKILLLSAVLSICALAQEAQAARFSRIKISSTKHLVQVIGTTDRQAEGEEWQQLAVLIRSLGGYPQSQEIGVAYGVPQPVSLTLDFPPGSTHSAKSVPAIEIKRKAAIGRGTLARFEVRFSSRADAQNYEAKVKRALEAFVQSETKDARVEAHLVRRQGDKRYFRFVAVRR